MSEANTVAIIGWGTAGVNTAIALRGAGYEGRILAFSDTEILPYSPILTSYFAGGEKTYDECFPWSADELDELDVEVVREGRVVELDCAAHRIRTQEGGEYGYDKCVVCVGAHPTTFGFPVDCGYTPLVLRTMDDAVRMKEAFASPACKSVLISGASMIALKSVEAALNRGLNVALVGMNEHILDFSATPEAAVRFERGLAKQGVRMRFGQTIARVDAVEDEGRRRLETTFSDGGVETFDEIVVAHGVHSDFGFIKDDALKVDHALVVDDFMRTSDPDVYAAGDAAQALELVSGQKKVLGIWKTAVLQGACAGRAIATELAPTAPVADAYPGAIMTNTIAVRGTLFISAGVSRVGEGQRAEVQEGDAMTVVRIFGPAPDGGERLVGFNVVSDVDEPGGVAYDTAAMLSLRIEEACRR